MIPVIKNEHALMLDELSHLAHRNALEHGFYDHIDLVDEVFEGLDSPKILSSVHRDFVLSQLSKVGCEVGECVDAVQRFTDLQPLSEELADVIIRVLDLAGYLDIDIGSAVVDKMDKNKKRPRLHGKLC